MALVILNGSLTTIDATLGAASVKCGFGRWLAQIVRGATRATVFCDNGWVNETPGDKQLIGQLDGYATTGTAWSDPLVWVTASATVAFVLTAHTGCTLTFAGNVFSDGVDVVAAANAGRSVGFRSAGVVTSAWVVA